MVIGSKSKSVLQRRQSIVNLLQPLLDGLAIISVAGFFIQYNVGFLTQDYIIFLLVLLGLVSVLYDRYAIYRTSSNFSSKIFSLFNAWTRARATFEGDGYGGGTGGERSRVGFVSPERTGDRVRPAHRLVSGSA